MQTDEGDNELHDKIYDNDPNTKYWGEVESIRRFRQNNPDTRYRAYSLREVFAPAEGVDAMPHNLILYILGIKKYKWVIDVGGG